MAEAPARAWLRQVASDYAAARRVFDSANQATFCHTIGKYQQVVEKAVKALLAAMREQGVLDVRTPRAHNVDGLIAALIRLPRRRAERRELQNQVLALLNEFRRGEIHALGALAPRWPGPGELFPRNTEYPFQLNESTWQAPSDGGVFQLAKDVQRFERLARHVHVGVSRLIDAIQLAPDARSRQR
ncbi:MAG: HEPN domain-containing protein [bacterium]|nr:HEPN domain-containing protein [bacterium]